MLSWLLLSALAGPLADRLNAIDTDLPLAEAIAARVAIDQEARKAFRPGLPPEEAQRIGEEVRAIDEANVAFLEQLLADGWVRVSDHGKKAAHQAWLLAQHADGEPELQKRILDRLHALAETGDALPKDVAYLHDRVAVNAGEAQRYGTQGRCSPEGWAPLALEDPEGVHALRADLGLEPLEAYVQRFDCDGRRAKAWEAYKAGEHESCAQTYAALGAERGASGDWYNAACCAALGNDTDAAFAHLASAWDAGSDNLDHVLQDSDLSSLHEDPRWAAFVATRRGDGPIDPRILLLVQGMAGRTVQGFLDGGAAERLRRPTQRLFKRAKPPGYDSAEAMLEASLVGSIVQLMLPDRPMDGAPSWIEDLMGALQPHRGDDGVLDLAAAEADIAAVLGRWSKAPKADL